MSCPTTAELTDFLAGRLTEAKLQRVAMHVDSCAHCQDRLDEVPESEDQGLAALRHLGEEPLLSSACCDMIERVLGAPATEHTEQPPREIRDYVLGSRLGFGGMGVVYEATHQRLKRPVAIKLLRRRHAKPGASTRFQREMEAIGRVEHTNIVRALDAGEAEGFEFLVMERIDGLNLRQIVDSGGRLDPPEACEVVRQAACALSHAHELNLVHRDVKPSNLMLAADGTVKLLDLGLALLAEQQWEETLSDVQVDETALPARDDTATGAVMGSAGYMSPEQAEDSHRVDYRTDIYSLGRTLLYLLMGKQPTEEDEDVGRLKKALEPKLARLLEEMTAHAPEHRPQTAGEIAYRLSHFCREAELATLADSSAENSQGPARVFHADGRVSENAPRLRGYLGWSVASLVLMFLAVGMVSWWNAGRGARSAVSESVIPEDAGGLPATTVNSDEVVEVARTTKPQAASLLPGVSMAEPIPAVTQTDENLARETATAFETKQGLAISVTRQQEDEITTQVLTGDDAQQYIRQRPMLNMQLLYRNKPMFVMVTEVKTEMARIRVERAVGFFARVRIWEGPDAEQPTYTFDGHNLNELMLLDDAWRRNYQNELLGQAPVGGSVSRGTVQLQATGHRTMMITDTEGFSIRIMEQLGKTMDPQSGIFIDAGPEPTMNVRATTLDALRAEHPEAALLYDQTREFFGDAIDAMARPLTPASSAPASSVPASSASE